MADTPSPIQARLRAIADRDLAERSLTPGEAQEILDLLDTAPADEAAEKAWALIQKARELIWKPISAAQNSVADGLLVEAQVALVGDELSIELWNRRREGNVA